MNSQKEYIEKFDQYLENKLNTDEKEKLKEKLKNDTKLLQEFEEHQKFVDGIKLHGRKQLLNEIEKWDNELDSSDVIDKPERRIGSFRLYYAAAAIIFLVVSAVIIYTNLQTGHENLVAKHYQPYEYIPSTQRGETEARNQKEQIFNLYDQGKYAEVLSMVEEIDESNRTDLLMYLQANAYQALEQHQSAMPIYDQVIAMNTTYAQGASWYLALCHLSEGQSEKAIILLEELQKSNSPYASKAINLLFELE